MFYVLIRIDTHNCSFIEMMPHLHVKIIEHVEINGNKIFLNGHQMGATPAYKMTFLTGGKLLVFLERQYTKILKCGPVKDGRRRLWQDIIPQQLVIPD